MQGTQAFLRKARWWVSEANPDEVEQWVSTKAHACAHLKIQPHISTEKQCFQIL